MSFASCLYYRPLKVRFFIVFIMLIVVAFSMFFNVLQVKAFVPAIPLIISVIPEVCLYAGILLAAVGLNFKADQTYDALLDEYYNSLNRSEKESLVNSSSSSSGTTVYVPDLLFSSAKNFVDTKFNNGDTLATGGSYNESLKCVAGTTYWTINGITISTTARKAIIQLDSSGIFQYDRTYSYEIVDSTTVGYKKAKLTVNGTSVVYSSDFAYDSTKTYYPFVRFYNYLEKTIDISFGLNDIYGNVLSNAYVQPSSNRLSPVLSFPSDVAIDFNTDIDVPRDWSEDGVRPVAVPTTWDDVVTASDTPIEDSSSIPTVPTSDYSGILGLIKSILESIGAWVADFWTNFTTNISTALEPVSGTLADIKASIEALVNGITSPIVDALTGVKNAVLEKVFDVTVSTPEKDADYQNWKVPADIIKNKFPFSIPWDLKNAISSLVATPKAPVWEIEFSSNYFVGGANLTIDFSMFDSWAKILRWGEFIAFNVFLILATRKIIGAGE